MSCSLGCRLGLDPTLLWLWGLDPTLLWLWHRLAATALIRPQAWKPPYTRGVALIQPLSQELPYAAGVAKKKKKKKLQVIFFPDVFLFYFALPPGGRQGLKYSCRPVPFTSRFFQRFSHPIAFNFTLSRFLKVNFVLRPQLTLFVLILSLFKGLSAHHWALEPSVSLQPSYFL